MGKSVREPTETQLIKARELVAEVVELTKTKSKEDFFLAPIFEAFAKGANSYHIVFGSLLGSVSEEDQALKNAREDLLRGAKVIRSQIASLNDIDLKHIAYRLSSLMVALAYAPYNEEVLRNHLMREVVLTHMMLTGAIQVLTLSDDSSD
ncbi:hypothetical protein phiLo_39 [Thermus phage phiLo]|nr:hypothetical protein phiLo_39 [Thermus phage phiLo]